MRCKEDNQIRRKQEHWLAFGGTNQVTSVWLPPPFLRLQDPTCLALLEPSGRLQVEVWDHKSEKGIEK